MQLLTGFAPFITFAVLARFAPASLSLWASVVVSLLLISYENRRGHSIKILDLGAFIVFVLLAIYVSVTHAAWNLQLVRVFVDGGLYLIIVTSLLMRRPFTLQYAREQVSEEVANTASFRKANYFLTSIWALALAIIIAADFAMYSFPAATLRIQLLVIAPTLAAAYWLTKWYPEKMRREADGRLIGYNRIPREG